MKYSRLESTEEKRNFRSATILLLLSICIIILLFVYGIPLVGKVASVVSGIKNGSSSTGFKDKTPPVPPSFNTFPDYINKQTFTLSGSAEPGVTVKVDLNGKSFETLSDKDGNFIFQDLGLNESENSFYAVAIDLAGNTSQKTPTKSINYDIKPPDLNIDIPSDGASYYGNTQRQINFQGTTESNTNLTINDRIVSVDENGKFQYPVTLNAGENVFTIKANDLAGNNIEKIITVNFSD